MLEFFIILTASAGVIIYGLELYQRSQAEDYSKYGSKFTVVPKSPKPHPMPNCKPPKELL